MVRRLLILVLTAGALVVVSGCGNRESVTTDAKTEGIWIDAGPLDYHIQGSRQLNPGQVPDDRYLAGVPAGFGQPGKDATWFAIFLRVENKTDKAAPTAQAFEIVDTEGHTFKPLPLDTKVNDFAYAPTTLNPGEVVPHPDSTQDLDSTAGAMLLFKIPLTEYQNRPLEFFVHSAHGAAPAVAKLALDV